MKIPDRSPPAPNCDDMQHQRTTTLIFLATVLIHTKLANIYGYFAHSRLGFFSTPIFSLEHNSSWFPEWNQPQANVIDFIV